MIRLYRDHIDRICASTTAALDQLRERGEDYQGVVFHAGSEIYYHADDQPMPFRRNFHFARFAPVAGPDHLLVMLPGKRPALHCIVPRDYWYESPERTDHPCTELLELHEWESFAAAVAGVGRLAHCAYVGNSPAAAASLGIAAAGVEPAALMARLDWDRGIKTPYEVECMRRSLELAAKGHAVVRAGVSARRSERALHASYLEATGQLENQLPYTNIIGWDDRAAVLHYQSKRKDTPRLGACLLIDAGADHLGYSSDITRTYVTEAAHPVFAEALERMEDLQALLCSGVRAGADYVELHLRAHRGIASILSDSGIVRGSAADAYELGLTHPFYPHGLGHHLGLQVHDVGGRQIAPTGEAQAPPDGHPHLRTTRRLEPGQVLTIEPGLYFIPMLLQPFREGELSNHFDWKLVDALTPCGGIRIEDNMLCTSGEPENLSRPRIPGHRD